MWIWLMSVGCNYLFAGGSQLLLDYLTPDVGQADSEHLLVHQTFARNISRVMSSFPVVSGGDLETLLNGLVVDYSGHPRSLPEKLTAVQVESGVPPDEFGVEENLLDIATGEPWHLLEDSEDALLPKDEWVSEPEKAQVYCDKSEWSHVVHLAFKRGAPDAFEQPGVVRSPGNTVEGELLMTSLGGGTTVEGELLMTSLGVDWKGEDCTVGPDGEQLCKLVVALLLAAAAEEPCPRQLQEVVGLACLCFTYQRALYACFSGVFRRMSAPRPGPLTRRGY